MVKEVKLTAVIENCSVQEYYTLIYKDKQAVLTYHERISKDPDAEVTDWEAGERQIKFRLPTKLPTMFKSFLGTDELRIQDKQTLVWHDKARFTVLSRPKFKIPGAENFSSDVDCHITDNGAGSCQVDLVVTCKAKAPWPMAKTIESFMAEQGRVNMNSWLDYCRESVQQHRSVPRTPLANVRADAALHYEPLSIEGAVNEDDGSGSSGEDFWDAQEDLRSSFRSAGTPAGRGASEMPSILAQLQQQSQETNRLLQALLKVAEANLAASTSLRPQWGPLPKPAALALLSTASFALGGATVAAVMYYRSERSTK